MPDVERLALGPGLPLEVGCVTFAAVFREPTTAVAAAGAVTALAALPP